MARRRARWSCGGCEWLMRSLYPRTRGCGTGSRQSSRSARDVPKTRRSLPAQPPIPGASGPAPDTLLAAMVNSPPMAARTVRTVCPRNCYGTCGMLVTVDGDRVVRIEGDPKNPATGGHICLKGLSYARRICAQNLRSSTPHGAQELPRDRRVKIPVTRMITSFRAPSAWHDIRLCGGHGPAVGELRTEVPGPERAAPRGPRAPRDLPGRDGSSPGGPGPAAVRRARVPRLPAVRDARPSTGLRAIPSEVEGWRAGAPGSAVQAAG